MAWQFLAMRPSNSPTILELWEKSNDKLESGDQALYGPVPIEFFEEILTLGADNGWWPEIPGNPDFESRNLFTRIMECLGSQTNTDNFVIADTTLNWVKGQLMQLHNPIAPGQQDEKIEEQSNYVLGILRACIAMFDYMNTNTGPDVFGKTSNIIDNILHQISHAELLWDRAHPGVRVEMVQFFVEWLRDYYGQVTIHTQRFLRGLIPRMRAYWRRQTGEQAFIVMETLASLEPRVDGLRIRTDWDLPILEDDDPMDEDEDTDMSG
ncbi:hypothetical protein ACJ41O_009427 [Fusarium nematophilum]